MSKNNHKHQDKAAEKAAEEKADIFDNVPEAENEISTPEDEANELIDEQTNEIDGLKQQLAEATAQVEKEKKEYLFLMAEFDNFRKRTVKEKAEIIKNASESVLKGLLPIVDDFERGIDASASSEDASSVREGMQLIYQKLVKFLASNGVQPIESTGKPFDPELHEAIAMLPVSDDSQKGIVIDTPTKGYTINDKVLRHAKVAVGQA